MNRHFQLLTATATATAAVAVALMTTGCDRPVSTPNEHTGPEATTQAAAALADLPSLEQARADLEGAVLQLAAYIDTLVPNLQWRWEGAESSSGCLPPYDHTDGGRVYLRHYAASAPVPDDVWPQVAQRAKELAAPLGAVDVEGFGDNPGKHGARYYGPDGVAFWVRSEAVAVITSNTGCRLPQRIQ